MDKSLIEKMQVGISQANEPTMYEALTLEQAVQGVLRKALSSGSNVRLEGLGDGEVAVIIRTDDPTLVRAFEAMHERQG